MSKCNEIESAMCNPTFGEIIPNKSKEPDNEEIEVPATSHTLVEKNVLNNLKESDNENENDLVEEPCKKPSKICKGIQKLKRILCFKHSHVTVLNPERITEIYSNCVDQLSCTSKKHAEEDVYFSENANNFEMKDLNDPNNNDKSCYVHQNLIMSTVNLNTTENVSTNKSFKRRKNNYYKSAKELPLEDLIAEKNSNDEGLASPSNTSKLKDLHTGSECENSVYRENAGKAGGSGRNLKSSCSKSTTNTKCVDDFNSCNCKFCCDDEPTSSEQYQKMCAWLLNRGRSVVDRVKACKIGPLKVDKDELMPSNYGCGWIYCTRPKKFKKSKFFIEPYDPYILKHKST